MKQNNTIIFVCEHGAAKSILAAAYFNQIADTNGLDLQAIARGTNPDPELSELVVKGLANEGLAPSESHPRELTLDDMHVAGRIVSFCELPTEYSQSMIIEYWNDVPPVSQDYDKARDAILGKVHDLLNRIRSSQ
jgi:protein-tyrosine-phosphatase